MEHLIEEGDQLMAQSIYWSIINNWDPRIMKLFTSKSNPMKELKKINGVYASDLDSAQDLLNDLVEAVVELQGGFKKAFPYWKGSEPNTTTSEPRYTISELRQSIEVWEHLRYLSSMNEKAKAVPDFVDWLEEHDK